MNRLTTTKRREPELFKSKHMDDVDENKYFIKVLKEGDFTAAAAKLGEYEDIDEDPERLRKKIKALEIIKEKGIDTGMFSKFGTYADYLSLCMESEVFLNLYGGYTEDEFDLVKGVLE